MLCEAGGVGAAVIDKINVKLTLEGVTVESKAAAGIYFPSSGKLTVKDSVVTGTSGVEIHGGELEVENSHITATAEEFAANPNGSGSTVTGAAIAVSQHATNHDMKENIKSGTFTGIKALYETDLQDKDSDNIILTIAGGTFDGQVESANVESFIEGGAFTEWPGEDLLADKTLAVQKGEHFYIGGDATEVIAEAEQGDKIIVLQTGGENLTVPEGVTVENASGEEITVNGETVADGDAVTVEKPGASGGDDEEDKPGKPNEPNPPAGDDDPADKDDEPKEDTDSPKTGDTISILPFILLAITAAAAVGVIVVLRRREK